MFPHDEIQVMPPQQENQRSNSVFLLHLIRWCMISIYPIPGDVCFDHMIKVVFAGLLHSKVTLFPYVINK